MATEGLVRSARLTSGKTIYRQTVRQVAHIKAEDLNAAQSLTETLNNPVNVKAQHVLYMNRN